MVALPELQQVGWTLPEPRGYPCFKTLESREPRRCSISSYTDSRMGLLSRLTHNTMLLSDPISIVSRIVSRQVAVALGWQTRTVPMTLRGTELN
eukprot:5110496-Prymnesium_polylepis.1